MSNEQSHTSRFTRRQLLLGSGALALVGTRTAPASAQVTPSAVASVTLVEGGKQFARFAGLVRLSLSVDLPTIEGLQSPTAQGRIPGNRRPPTVLLRRSAQLTALSAWMTKMENEGGEAARKTLRLVARDANRNVLYRLRLRDALPQRLAKGGLEKDPDGTFVALALLACRTIEIIDVVA